MTSFDVVAARKDFPALAEGLAHFDGPGGTQLPEQVSAAVVDTMRSAVSNVHGPFASSRRADAIVGAARQAVADLVGGTADGVVFGQSMTANTYRMAGALGRTWRPGDEIVLSRLDHDADVRPWEQAATRAGCSVRWAEVDAETGELPTEQYAGLLTERTRLVAVSAASNAIGTRPDVRAIADLAHEVGALVHVDGVHATPHLPTDLAELGADLYATSAYKWYGPHLAATVADPVLLESLHPDKLLPSSDAVPDRFELGTANFAALSGVTAAVDWLASHAAGTRRRERVLSAMTAIGAHEQKVFARLLAGLAARDDVTLVGAPARRTPTLAFTVAGRSPLQVSADLGNQGVCVCSGDYYAIELMTALGLADAGGAVRAGVVCYTTEDEVDRLLAAL